MEATIQTWPTMTRPSLILTLLLPVMALVMPAHAQDAAALLSAYRQASGAPAAPAEVTLTFAATGQDLTGQVVLRYDSANGLFREAVDLPPTYEGHGYDGKHAWQTDISGISFPQQGGDRPALAINAAYRLANAWWLPDAGQARVEKRGEEPDGSRLRITPPGGKPFDVWFEPHTHLPTRLSESRGFQTTEVRYRDYRREHGLMLPHTTVIEEGGDTRTLSLQKVQLGARQPAAAYAAPAPRTKDWRLDSADGRTTLPMRLLNNHVFVDVQVNGAGPFPFLLDTGGHDILTPATVEALRLRSVGNGTSGGGGERTLPTGYAQVGSLQIGKARIDHQTMIVLDFAPRAIEGLQVGGMLGLSTLQRFVVQIDYAAGTVTLIDPARFDPTQAGSALPFVFYDHMPQLAGAVDGIPARITIDTGSRSEITRSTPFVQTHDLATRLPGGVEMLSGWGAGGPVTSHRVRLRSLALGGLDTADVVVDLSNQSKGFFADANSDGNIGSGWLKRFVVTFDYAHQVMYLRPLARADADIGSADRSGMWINLAEGGFHVVALVPGGPAAEAGLREGDVITAIDGNGPSRLSLSDARRQMRTMPAGTRVKLKYLRGGSQAEASMTLRDLLPPHAD